MRPKAFSVVHRPLLTAHETVSVQSVSVENEFFQLEECRMLCHLIVFTKHSDCYSDFSNKKTTVVKQIVDYQ